MSNILSDQVNRTHLSAGKLDNYKLGTLVTVEYIFLIWVYQTQILDSSLSYTLRLPEIWRPELLAHLILGYIYSILPLIWFRFGPQVSKAIYIYLIFSLLVPSIIFIVTNTEMSSFDRHFRSVFIVFCFLFVYLIYLVPPINSLKFIFKKRLVWIFLAVLLFFGTTFLLLAHPQAVSDIRFFDVYDKRLELRDALTEGTFSRATVYLTNWIGVAVAPFLAAYGIYKRRLVYIFAAFGAALVAFSVSHHKIVFFSTLIVFLFALLLRFSAKLGIGYNNYQIGVAVVVVIGFLLAAVALDKAADLDGTLTFFIPFRMFLNNGYLTSAYFEYFQDEKFLFYADSFLSSFVSSDHELSYSRRLGNYITLYEGRNNASANFLADGYVNLGYFGMLFSSLQVAFVFLIIDSITRGKHQLMCVCIVLPAAMVFSNGPVHTALTTNGVLIILLLLLLVPDVGRNSGARRVGQGPI